MHSLDNPKWYKRLDPKNVRGSVDALSVQCAQAWSEMKKVKLPADYKKVTRVCINGMGGSALGGHMLRSIFDSELSVPLDVVNGYTLPAYVDRDTLLILSSYSGTTEEVLATCNEAVKRKAKIFVIAQGGKLAAWARAKKIPCYIFNDAAGNPSQQPRMGLGYSVFGQLALLAKLKLVKVSDTDVRQVVGLLMQLSKRWNAATPLAKNPAKKLAVELHHSIVNIVAAEHVVGTAHVWANQTNETAKTFSDFRAIPELNHHLLEGLMFPRENRKHLRFLFLESNLYGKRVQSRFAITKRVVQGNKVKFSSVRLTAPTRLTQAVEALLLGSYVTLYQGLLSGVNPSSIPWVEYFKRELSKVR